MRITLTIYVILGLVWLGYSCYQHDKADAISYPEASIQRLNSMSAGIAPLKLKQANGIMEALSISEDDLKSNVNIFGE